MKKPQTFTIGLISDTHGLLRDEAMTLLAGSHRIIHAGDIGDAAILERLSRIAPVDAIRGNNDIAPWAAQLHETLTLQVAGIKVHVVHSLADMALDPGSQGIRAVVAGHSHRPSMETRDGVIYINPGSAGPRRFKLPLTVAKMHIAGEDIETVILPIEIAPR
ncbi:metallophosphoesterase family protein [Robbsia sp. Bb-Pol-6]|uniref:Phosphoesterase n=1 Tax=Robbsia betulipollinis TaxID=2981849 RepID=A0ABT3ZIA6_9BURK|nr:metallophosphoesterase family protein [Robbsia betulipollinis]MCY0386259.1 metallophosphoesterase family protein [Robbsia betulipollinis]